MGTYVYSLRKAHKEVSLDGIYPVDVIPLRFAYKVSNPWPGDYGYAAYARMEGRVGAMAEKAQDHHIARVADEFGEVEGRHFYLCIGGDKDFQEGLDVYRTTSRLPATWCDGGGIPGAEYVGKLYKIGRKWVISKECPGHVWKDTESHKGDFRSRETKWLPSKTCKRCDHSEYKDAALEAQYQAHRKAQEMKEAA